MVVIDGVEAVANGMVSLAEADVDGEVEVDEGVDEDVEVAAEETAQTQLAFSFFS